MKPQISIERYMVGSAIDVMRSCCCQPPVMRSVRVHADAGPAQLTSLRRNDSVDRYGVSWLDIPTTVLDYRRGLRDSIIFRTHRSCSCRPGGYDRHRLELSALSPDRLGAKCSRCVCQRRLFEFRHRHLLWCRCGLHGPGSCYRHRLDRPDRRDHVGTQPGTRAHVGVGHPTHDRRPTSPDPCSQYGHPDGNPYCDGRPCHGLGNLGGWAPVLHRSGCGAGRGHAWRRPRPRPLQQAHRPRQVEGACGLASRGLLPPMRIGLLALLTRRRHTITSAVQAGAVPVAGLEGWWVRQNLTSPVS